jgi:hypothetical protein
MRATQNTQNNNIPKLHYLTLRSNCFSCWKQQSFIFRETSCASSGIPVHRGERCADEGRG